MKEDKDKAITFFRNKGINARQISKTSSGKIPDLELYISDALFGYCEIKSIIDYNFIGERNDSSYNKVQNKIHEASKQFKAHNPNHKIPNILLSVNHYRHINFSVLWTVLTGQETSPLYPSEPVDIRYAKRLARKSDLDDIDYFIWIDVHNKKVSYTLNDISEFKESLKRNISSVAYEEFIYKENS